MNIYALFPVVATIAYIPLLITTLTTHPWRSQHRLFALLLIAAMSWSLTDFFFRNNFFPQYNELLFKLIVIMFVWMVVQFHHFNSSFYPATKGRWLPFAYGSLVVVIILVLRGYVTEGVTVVGNRVYPQYGTGIYILAIPLIVLAARSVTVLLGRLRIQKNPVLYNQIVSLLLSILVLGVFTFTPLLPWGREFPITHLGNIIIALILSYAVIGHQLLDIRLVVRRGLIWASIAIIGIALYWLILFTLHSMFNFQLDLTATALATIVAILVFLFLYKLRSILFKAMGKAFQGQSYDYRQKLLEFANRIHNVFSLREQGSELLTLAIKAIGCKRAGLLFIDANSEDFSLQLAEPKSDDNPLVGLRLTRGNPIVTYLQQERKLLSRENLAILPQFLGMLDREKAAIEANEIELLMPLISRERLIGVMVLSGKQNGRYNLEDLNILEDITNRVAVSMEKEYLREQLKEREEELSIINRSSAIITSSLDIQRIYDSFIKELKKVIDVDWAAIGLIEVNEIYFLALSTEIGSAWQAGERIPLKGTAAEWIAANRKPIIDADLSVKSRFATGKYHLQQGIRSIAYLPLIISEEVIGTLAVASRRPNAYSQRHIKLLEQLASQIAMPIENSRLYKRAERMARIDELTGLLNRRSMDEMFISEIGRHSRYGGVFSLIILDLDSFKSFNDNYGHLTGDALLRQIGSIIKDSIREADQAFRYGGDEFAILLPQTTVEAASKVAERVRQQVLSKTNSSPIPVSVSLGIASWPADGVSPNDIIAAADAALYYAKRSGGNRSQCAPGTLTPVYINIFGSGDSQDSEALSTIFALAATVDARDHYTRSHSKKVKEYTVALGEALELDLLEINRLGTCALLHDIGKIGISDEILNKQGKLTDKEWEVIKTHPRLGAAIASHSRQLAPCIPGILHHHERYAGGGYPEGLKGEEIPLEARVLAIADAFTAMTSDRSYSKALPTEAALEELKQGAGTQFDPHLVDIFLKVVKNTINLQVKVGGL